MRSYITVRFDNGARSHFAMDDDELVETVDDRPDGSPDWTGAGICDARHEEPPGLHGALVRVLRFIAPSGGDA